MLALSARVNVVSETTVFNGLILADCVGVLQSICGVVAILLHAEPDTNSLEGVPCGRTSFTLKVLLCYLHDNDNYMKCPASPWAQAPPVVVSSPGL